MAIKVRVEVVPWLTDAFGARRQGRLILEEEVAENSDVGDLIRILAAREEDFGRMIFDPGTKRFTGQISVILNDRFLESPSEWDTRLREEDTIILLPAFAGG